jgi:hypothetical protein
MVIRLTYLTSIYNLCKIYVTTENRTYVTANFINGNVIELDPVLLAERMPTLFYTSAAAGEMFTNVLFQMSLLIPTVLYFICNQDHIQYSKKIVGDTIENQIAIRGKLLSDEIELPRDIYLCRIEKELYPDSFDENAEFLRKDLIDMLQTSLTKYFRLPAIKEYLQKYADNLLDEESDPLIIRYKGDVNICLKSQTTITFTFADFNGKIITKRDVKEDNFISRICYDKFYDELKEKILMLNNNRVGILMQIYKMKNFNFIYPCNNKISKTIQTIKDINEICLANDVSKFILQIKIFHMSHK